MAPSGSGTRARIRAAAGLLVALVALAATMVAGAASTGGQISPRPTVAAIDPSLVAGRGAQLGIVEQEAENATTNGTILPFDTSAYTLSGEASGRQAVKLAPGPRLAQPRFGADQPVGDKHPPVPGDRRRAAQPWTDV